MGIFKPIGSNTNAPFYSNLGLIEFTHPTFGADLAQNPGFAGTPDGVHDGTDTALWTATNLSGTNWVFDSTAQAQAGTKSIDGTGTVGTDSMLLSRSSTINSGDYAVLTGWIYITSWNNPQNGTRDILLQLRNNGVNVGNSLGLLANIEPNNLNAWQRFEIQVTDFLVTATDFDEMVITILDNGAGAPPDFYLDTIDFQESGGAIVFSSPVPAGFSMRLEQFSITLARPYASTNEDYDKIIGKTLNNGILLQVFTPFGAINLGVFRRHVDFMFPPGVTYYTGGDGTNRWVTYQYELVTPIMISGDLGGEYRVVIQDDLSDFVYAQAGARGEIVNSTNL